MKGYILRWNPHISSWTKERHKQFFKQPYDSAFKFMNWSIYDYENLKEGDFFILQQVGTKNDGIAMIGTFASRAYADDSWKKDDDKNIFYADMFVDVVINRKKDAPLSAKKYEQLFPDIDWHSGHSGILIDDKILENLIQEIIADLLKYKKPTKIVNFSNKNSMRNALCRYIYFFCPNLKTEIIENYEIGFNFDNKIVDKMENITSDDIADCIVPYFFG